MNEFALGVFVGLAGWKVGQVPFAIMLASRDYTFRFTFGTAMSEMGQAVFWMFLSVLVFTGVIL